MPSHSPLTGSLAVAGLVLGCLAWALVMRSPAVPKDIPWHKIIAEDLPVTPTVSPVPADPAEEPLPAASVTGSSRGHSIPEGINLSD